MTTQPELNGARWFVVAVGAAMTLASAGFSIWSTYIMVTRGDPGIWAIIWVLWCVFWTFKWASIPLKVLADTRKNAPTE
jgi:hypothetical protein